MPGLRDSFLFLGTRNAVAYHRIWTFFPINSVALNTIDTRQRRHATSPWLSYTRDGVHEASLTKINNQTGKSVAALTPRLLQEVWRVASRSRIELHHAAVRENLFEFVSVQQLTKQRRSFIQGMCMCICMCIDIVRMKHIYIYIYSTHIQWYNMIYDTNIKYYKMI